MLSGVVQPVNDVNERSRLPLQPYHSVWLAHWKKTDCDAAGETVSLNALGSEEIDCMSKKDCLAMELEVSTRSANRLGKIKNRTFELGDDFINAGGKSVVKERMFSSIVKDGQDADDVQVLIPELAQNLELNKSFHNSIGIPWSGCHSLEEDDSDNPPKLKRTCSARKDSLMEMQKSSGIRLSHSDCYSQLKLQKCVNGLGTMRICTPVVVSGRTLAGFPRFSETNNDMSITEKTFFRVPNIIGNMSGDHSVPFFVQNNQRIQLQSRSCLKSMDTVRNELSPATDEMSMESLMDNTSKKNLHSGSNSTASAKNKKLVEQPKVKYKFPNPDSGNRWVKRLKISSLNSSIKGMKSSSFSSTAYHERRSKLFNGVPKSNTINSEPNIGKHHNDKGIALLLSHGWIRRWRRIKTKEVSSEEEALSEPESPKMEVDKFNEMQTPSIAAMAMMATDNCIPEKLSGNRSISLSYSSTRFFGIIT